MKLALRHILVATDFSDESRGPLAYGAALARTFNASLHVLHVLQAVVPPRPGAQWLDDCVPRSPMALFCAEPMCRSNGLASPAAGAVGSA